MSVEIHVPITTRTRQAGEWVGSRAGRDFLEKR